MHLTAFDSYQSRESVIHRLDPRIKVVLTVLMILSNVLLPDGAWLAFVLSWGLILVINEISRLSARFLLIRSFIALPFALAAISVLFTMPGNPVVALDVGKSILVVSDAGLIRFASILIRSWLSVQSAIVLTATTSFPDLIHALRHLRVPAILLSIISFMYRYLFVLSDETQRLLRAREARSAASPAERKHSRVGGSLGWRARVAGNMVGQLFLRSFERSDRVYHAMLARGYQGELLTMNPHELKRKDWLIGWWVLASLILLQVIGRGI